MATKTDENFFIEQWIDSRISELELARKHLHQNPELSENEHNTQEFILNFLEQRSRAKTRKIAGTGVLASIETNKDKSILIRVDIDALPIAETNDFEYRSTVDGVSHKCGHDGHTTIGLGLTWLLSAVEWSDCDVYILFQPAEENGFGAAAVLSDIDFSALTFDYVFALHNLPGFNMHQIAIKEHAFTPAVRSLVLQLKGKTSHAAEPENGINPALALAELLQLADKFTVNQPTEDSFFLATPIYTQMGEKAYGISAGDAELHLTFRTWDSTQMSKLSDDYLSQALEICAKHQLETEYQWLEEFHANKNHPEAVQCIKKAAIKNELLLKQLVRPFRWGEDFGLFTQKYKGAMFGIGSGKDTPALHNPDYDFPDQILKTGILMFYQILKESTNT